MNTVNVLLHSVHIIIIMTWHKIYKHYKGDRYFDYLENIEIKV